MFTWSDIGTLAAVLTLVTLPLVMSENGIKFLSLAIKTLLRTTRPSLAKCERLLWEDIPEGIISEDLPVRESITQLRNTTHSSSKRCWLNSLAKVFPRTWNSPFRRPARVDKPISLACLREYVCTDAKTLLAFIICSARPRYSDGETYPRSVIDWYPEGLRFSVAAVELWEVENSNTLVAHLHGSMLHHLTKGDLEGILAGYPPWYREYLQKGQNQRIPHPIQEPSDIFRAGWVIAVGLFWTTPLLGPQLDRTLKYKPIKRVFDILSEKIMPEYPDNDNIISAVKVVRYMWETGSDSGVERYLTPDLFYDRPNLSESCCVLAMRVFNDLCKLSHEDKSNLTPILLQVLQAAVHGTKTVVSHYKDHELNEDWVPPCLRDPKRLVYIQDCSRENH
ncbi:hypothetical protein L207DRAFT_573100 [Hyaloscypha variabilis F]|uniref:Uncharacterized protein n=1 Tax=Hyaloscypha variabilis (strain UAMH 11265 / GT02V1 / F) TaxID=1149755 RepID=A0A2J6QXL0_HYAVF|nr:hypothetical protein L207DRAFT_573100 [Hyaloscypha variabilis F]